MTNFVRRFFLKDFNFAVINLKNCLRYGKKKQEKITALFQVEIANATLQVSGNHTNQIVIKITLKEESKKIPVYTNQNEIIEAISNELKAQNSIQKKKVNLLQTAKTLTNCFNFYSKKDKTRPINYKYCREKLDYFMNNLTEKFDPKKQ